MVEIITAVISVIGLILTALIKRQQVNEGPTISSINTKLFQFKEKTENQLKIMSDKITDTKDDMRGLLNSMSTLKKEIQDIHISHAKIDLNQIKETYGKVIVLEERSKAFERMHLQTAKELGEIKKKAREGG